MPKRERWSKPPTARTRKAGSSDVGLDALLNQAGIKTWDILLVGDGSGSSWGRQAGWGAVSVERLTMERQVWAGGMNTGTVNFAEMMAYLQPLTWFAAREEDRRKRNKRPTRVFHVHILTDSDYCRSTGSGTQAVKANAGLWSAFDAFALVGFVLHWHWIPRASCRLNDLADALSKLARKLVKAQDWEGAAVAELGAGETVYDVNPSDG